MERRFTLLKSQSMNGKTKLHVLNSMTTNVLKLLQGKAPGENKALTQVTFGDVQSCS